ncbi:MCM3-associated protein [Aspergillus sclerotialis]|uniref:MCM3-associated protein n=1 Tax=Aspergillus sclerotialis TaxID=2070753 RepID=A0A3A2ZJ36_9EURO|nr:MCM3-associated protein [Aspergillus sclerotialis]
METKMLKRFRRSAAGYDEQLPSDIRTPKTLLQSTNYLIRHVIGGPEPLGIIHKFVWDRTRSIRNDFSVQQLTQEDDVKMAVTCLERIARFHIVSLHLLSSPANTEQFDRHQEREQLNNTMLSLMYYYDDNRGRVSFPNEDEFRAYYIILSIHDQRPDLEARVQKWPAELRNSPRVQIALELFAAAGNAWEYQGTLDAKRPNAIAQGFYTRFFSLVDSPSVSYLMGCVAEIYFNHMRQTAIRSIWKAYCRSPASQQHKNEEWTIDELTKVLCFDDNDQTVKFCEEQDLELAENENGEPYLYWGNRPVDSVAFQPSSDHAFSEKIVESKRAGRTLVAVVLGLNIKEAANLGMIDSSVLSKRTHALPPRSTVNADDDSLFVSEDENDVQSSNPLTNGDISHSVPFGGPSDSASSLRNAVEQSSQLPSEEPSTSQPTAPSLGQTPAQPSEPPKSFPSPFSGNTPPSNPFGASKAAVPNPFGAISSPFAPLKSEVQKAPSVFSTTPAEQPGPLFPTQGPVNSMEKKDEAPAPASTPQFKFPSFQQATTTAPTLGTAATAPPPSSTPQFKLPSFSPSTTPPPPTSTAPETASPAPASSVPTTAIASTAPQFQFPSFPQSTNSPAPSFNTPSTAPSTSESTTAGKPPTSIFDSVQQPTFSTGNTPLFNLSTPSTAPKETETKEPAKEPTQPTQVPSLFASSASSEQFTPKQKDIPPAFPSTTPSATPPSSIFSTLKPAPVPTPREMKSIESHATRDSQINQEKQVEEAPAAAQEVSHTSHHQHQRLHDQEKEITPNVPAIPLESEEPVVIAEDSSVALRHEEGAADDKLPIAPKADEDRPSWIESLREAALKRREEPSTSRKRVHEEQEEQDLGESILRASKLTKADETPRKTSLALSSIKPLPKLPILEQIESMNSYKPVPKKPEPQRTSQIDEDELLLSAARIAAESLRRGPSLFEAMEAYYEPHCSSYSPRSSFSSSLPPSRSVSSHSRANGYDIAYGPDNLGLGRSMSRTEQRIRMTGGSGLAYKPLDFTPRKENKGKGKEL